MTQDQLASRINYSTALVGSVEKAERKPSRDFAQRCDDALGTDGLLARLWELVKGEAFPSWFRERAEEVEPHARKLRSWQPFIVYGLLQTEEYARGLLRLHPGMTGEQVEERTAARMGRQKILDRDEPPQLRVILHENVLHYQVGSPKTMSVQLQALIEAAQRPHVTVQIVPASAAVHSGMNGAFVIASLGGEPDVVYLESARAGQVIDRQEDVQATTDIWEAIGHETLPVSASLDLISKVMEQWT